MTRIVSRWNCFTGVMLCEDNTNSSQFSRLTLTTQEQETVVPTSTKKDKTLEKNTTARKNFYPIGPTPAALLHNLTPIVSQPQLLEIDRFVLLIVGPTMAARTSSRRGCGERELPVPLNFMPQTVDGQISDDHLDWIEEGKKKAGRSPPRG